MSPEAQHHSLNRVFSRPGETGGTREIIDRLGNAVFNPERNV